MDGGVEITFVKETMTGITNYNVGVQCFPERKDRPMAMVYQPGSQRRRMLLVRSLIQNFLAGQVGCAVRNSG